MKELESDPPGDDSLAPVVDSIVSRMRRGEQPSPDDYAARYPELASRIHSVFPVLEAMEQGPSVDPSWADAPDQITVRGCPAPFGRYDLLRELGRGGMGVVYLAWDRDAQRLVALKVLRPGTLEDARFVVEMRVLARVEHESVVPLYEAGEHEGVRYFTMRFIEGGDLAGRIGEYAVPTDATRQKADEAARRVAALMAKVARAVGHVHRHGILHRDLKPGNILIGDDGRPLVSDFGLSRRFAADAMAPTLADTASTEPESRPGHAVGTRGYWAPEQAQGGKVLTTAADIFSLGAILYRLLAGTIPFEDGTPTGFFALLDPHREATPPSASNRALAPGSDLEWVCLTCLAKDPASRYATADALADDLGRVASGEPIRRPDRGWPGRALRVLRRRKRHSSDRAWGQVELIEAALNFTLHAGLFGLIRAGSSAAACWSWYLAFEAATWWVFLARLFRGRRSESSEQDLLVLWVGISLAGLTLFAVYCPPTGSAGSAGLLGFYPPWAAATGLGLFLAGRIHWGGLYLFGIGFFLLALLMPLAIEFAPLAYGVYLALGLVWTGRVHVWSAGKAASTRP